MSGSRCDADSGNCGGTTQNLEVVERDFNDVATVEDLQLGIT
jgi:hypothetical protein